jgi:ABC-type multidrug transport system ATPase subunit
MKIENLTMKYDKILFENISCTINSGKITLLLGNNGVGKTTLLRIIANTIKPTSGKISGNDKSVGLLFGEDAGFYKDESVYLNIQYFADLNLMSEVEFLKSYAAINSILNLDEIKKLKIKDCSKGQKQKVAIARTMIANPDILLLDEPTNGLDYSIQAKLHQLILNYSANEDKVIIISTHHLNDALKLIENIDQIIYINGQTIEITSEVSISKIEEIFNDMGSK